MGKGGQKVLDSEKEYSWNEVKKHSERNDKWIVIENNIYDITNWSKKHPGGSKVISHYAGQDATEPFNAFHPEKDFVKKFLKSIHIGKVTEAEKNMTKAYEIENAMKEDFEQLRIKARKMGLFNPSIFFYAVSLLQLIALEAISILVLYKFGSGWLTWIITILLCGTLQAQAGWIQHDFAHLSVFKKSKWNHFFHKYLMSFTKGASAAWWNHLHYQHHAKPNVMDKDPDVRLDQIFVVGENIPKRVAKKKSSMPYNLQHKYFFAVGPPFLFPIYFQFMVFHFAITRKHWMDLFLMICFYSKISILYSQLLGGLGYALIWLFLVRVVESHWFVWVSQSNHIPMEIDEDKFRPWLSLQLHATCDIEKGIFNDWFTGHLNFQIEHHLFPTMPRHNLYKIKSDVEAICKKHQVPCVTKSLSQAFGDIPKSLKNSGEIWLAHYNMHHH